MIKREQKFFGRWKEPLIEIPDLVNAQTTSFKWLIEKGLTALFEEFSPIKDYSDKKFELSFTGFELAEAKFDEHYAKDNKLSYEAPLKVRIKLKNKMFNSEKEQEIFLADFPLMTSHGTFIINGIERVIVPQLARSFGVFFTSDEVKGKMVFGAKVIPARGVWLEIETDNDGTIYARIDRKRKFMVTALLRVLGMDTDEKIMAAFKGDETAQKAIAASLAKDTAKTVSDAYIEIHKRLRDGDLATADNAREFIASLFNKDRYDLSNVGRFRFNKRFNKPMDEKTLERKTIDANDLATIIGNIIHLNNKLDAVEDDIDHLGSRRVRYVGELMQQKLRVGLSQMKRNIQDRMSTIEPGTFEGILHNKPALTVHAAGKHPH
jgi:DNA-directed RNA polymerase subunit beta